MQVIIYGKDDCVECNKARMLCQIQSIDFQYHLVGQGVSVDELQAKVGQPVRSLPQIFIQQGGADDYVGGYDALRQALAKQPAVAVQ